MEISEILRAWSSILQGRYPSLSIEVTKECPLRCPGCYAYDSQHLGGGTTLRQLVDFKGQELIDAIVRTVDEFRPLHLSLVGGDPLVRYREMEAVIPLLTERGIHVQLVTSAFRPLPTAWAKQERLNVVVSIDGLQPEHDQRRAPATYERILRNIEGGRITIHCTITGQMRKRKDYLAEFLQFWHPRPEIKRLWFSIFTPQIGDQLPEILTPEERIATVEELLVLREKYPKVEMPEGMIRAYLKPPASPEECTFAQTTHTLSADFHTAITPCQFGGEPDCSSCGCIASAGLHAIGEHKLARVLPVKVLFRSSLAIGRLFRGRRRPVNRPSDLVDTILPAPAPPSARYRSKAEG